MSHDSHHAPVACKTALERFGVPVEAADRGPENHRGPAAEADWAARPTTARHATRRPKPNQPVESPNRRMKNSVNRLEAHA